MNPKVCLETGDEGPGQPMDMCRPFYLLGELPLPILPVKVCFAQVRVFPALWVSFPLLLGGRSGLLWTNQIPPQPQLQK